MIALESVEYSEQEVACLKLPRWADHLNGRIECLSQNEAVDIILMLLPNASILFCADHRIVAVNKNVKYIIDANNMKHQWSEDHCADEITIIAYSSSALLLKKKFHLSSVSNLSKMILDCKLV